MNNEMPFGITKEEVLELVASKIADSYVDESDGDGEPQTVTAYVMQMINSRIERELNNALRVQIGSALATAINAQMTDFLKREIVPVNQWGEPNGKGRAIREILEEQAKVYWTQLVDSSGEAGRYDSKMPRAEWMFRRAAGEAYAAETKQILANLIGPMKDGMRIALNQQTDRILSELINVRSASEQKN